MLLSTDKLLYCTILEFIHLEELKLYKNTFFFIKGNSFNSKSIFFIQRLSLLLFFFFTIIIFLLCLKRFS